MLQRTFGYARQLSDPSIAVATATITVYKAGTLTLATIYDDDLNVPTPKANPFLADQYGYWYFYSKSGAYDVRISGGTPAVTAYTLGDVWAGLSGEVVNVREYGAVGDGVTDDTVAIEAAKTACYAAGGGVLYFPPGTYAFDYTLSNPTFGLYFNNTITVAGAGRHLTIFKNLSATAAGIRSASGYFNFRDFTIDNNGSTGNAFELGGQFSRATDLIIQNQAGAGYAFVCNGATLAVLDHVFIQASSNGLRMGPTPTNYITCRAVSIEPSSGTALSINLGSNIRFFGLYLEPTNDAGNLEHFIHILNSGEIDFFSLGAEFGGTHVLTDDSYVLIEASRDVHFYGGRINHTGTASKSFFKTIGAACEHQLWDGWEIITTKTGMVLFEEATTGTGRGRTYRNIRTVLSAAAVGVKHTTAVELCRIDNWLDNNFAASHSFNGPDLFVANVVGDIAVAAGQRQVFINCQGAFTGTGVQTAMRLNSPHTTALKVGSGGTAAYADNATALAAGLLPGDVYKTATGVLMVVY